MVEHQHSIMSVLGIDLWIPKTGVQTRAYRSDLYRDQVSVQPTAEYTELNVGALTVHEPVEVHEESHTSQPVDKLTKSRLQLDQQASTEIIAATQLSTADNQLMPLVIEPFELQAWVTSSNVIVLEATHMSAEQANLWRNIQSAQAGHFASLKWPFALFALQDGRGVSAYIQGFIDALNNEKKVLCLGRLTHAFSGDVLQLPSLQEMLDQPLLKRELWNHMRQST